MRGYGEIRFVARMSEAISGGNASARGRFPDVAPLIRATAENLLHQPRSRRLEGMVDQRRHRLDETHRVGFTDPARVDVEQPAVSGAAKASMARHPGPARLVPPSRAAQLRRRPPCPSRTLKRMEMNNSMEFSRWPESDISPKHPFNDRENVYSCSSTGATPLDIKRATAATTTRFE
jgi:hypothetical protein